MLLLAHAAARDDVRREKLVEIEHPVAAQAAGRLKAA